MTGSQVPVCILASQYFGWGIYGGFGSMSRMLAESLVGAGYEVEVIVPRRHGQEPHEVINGVQVRSFPITRPAEAYRLIQSSRARIFHSQDPTVLTAAARAIHPGRIHLITCRDPRDLSDWWTEFLYATPKRRLITPLNYISESGPLIGAAVRRADAVYVPAHFLRTKVQRMYRLPEPAGFMPNLIDVPPSVPDRTGPPAFVSVARWDRRKRPEMFLDLARAFPAYQFVAVGQGSASAESSYDATLRTRYGGIPNLQLPGFINKFKEPERMSALLGHAHVFVNTAAREGLPLTFLEAAAHGCAILSAVNPDGFADRFGVQVTDGNFVDGVRRILAADPEALGARAREYVLATYERSAALKAHIAEYDRHVRLKHL
jgi:glycosyltransferase involved in cell wall biosynthesis